MGRLELACLPPRASSDSNGMHQPPYYRFPYSRALVADSVDLTISLSNQHPLASDLANLQQQQQQQQGSATDMLVSICVCNECITEERMKLRAEDFRCTYLAAAVRLDFRLTLTTRHAIGTVDACTVRSLLVLKIDGMQAQELDKHDASSSECPSSPPSTPLSTRHTARSHAGAMRCGGRGLPGSRAWMQGGPCSDFRCALKI
eukprot:1157470-Pelagomonas_calceolata.AAC.3